MSSSDKIITVIVLAAVAYILYNTGILTAKAKTSSAVNAECPRGQTYSRGLFGDCDPNYKMDWMGSSLSEAFSGGNCVCMSQVNKERQRDITGTAQEASRDRQETTHQDVPVIAAPVIPDSSPTSPSSSSWLDAGTDVLTKLSDFGNWIVNPMGWKL